MAVKTVPGLILHMYIKHYHFPMTPLDMPSVLTQFPHYALVSQ